jgi:hypothetical protein
MARTELAKIYQRQDKLAEAYLVVEEALSIDPINSYAMSELLGVLRKQKNAEQCSSRFFNFIDQPRYRFGRHSQAPVFRFLLCCRDFGMEKEAGFLFERFGPKLDERNRKFYMQNFT